jgi:hypothetical protein
MVFILAKYCERQAHSIFCALHNNSAEWRRNRHCNFRVEFTVSLKALKKIRILTSVTWHGLCNFTVKARNGFSIRPKATGATK